MSKYIKLEDAIKAIEEMQNCYNGWSDTYDKAQIIGVLEELPTIEADEDCISRLRDYQIEWLTSHFDIELEPKLEQLIIRFLNDTTEMFIKENAPSVVTTQTNAPNTLKALEDERIEE